ncbi:AAA15 family ATPase/GTPase [Flavobacterium sp. 2755]|uniref:AAA family ATPase n=1 Tax=Flavobacterium sp. 2755 TaxID=2817765 RepID=UPI0028573B1E|nr:ATP-binding protein [Flavobacterium sp. 2755]MDR6763295.1 AAA15 family ATPase/GTPase [Flavobacterium sp. 2755]
MLVKFSVCNFLSFKENTSISFSATSLTEHREENIFQSPINDISLLKSLIVYGANSSGKSNLFSALGFMKRFVLNSSKDSISGEEIGVERFRLSTETIKKPSFFELEFIIESTKYRYGFKVDSDRVHSEYLYYQIKTKEYVLFERDFQEIIRGKKIDKANEKLFDITRENALFLSVCAQFNDPLATSIIKEIRKINFITGLDDFSSSEYTARMLSDNKSNVFINDLLKSANLGFKEIKVERVSTEDLLLKSEIPKELYKIIVKNNPENNIISTKHDVYNEKGEIVREEFFDLNSDESLGTRKFFALAGPLVDALIDGKVLIIDEFDSRLHPELCKAIIKLFNSSRNNPRNAQLIIASHNSTFINSNNKLFRRDQIIIARKNKYGVTKMKSLFDLKIRKDASFEKDYLSGKYNGVEIDLNISNQFELDL